MKTQHVLLAVGVGIVVVLVALIVLPGIVKAPGSTTATTTDQTPSTTPAAIPDLITINSPLPNQKVASPLTLTGQARGNWYFEASSPILIKDAQGNVIGQSHTEAQGDWMTEDFVPFKATLTFTPQPAGSKGTIEFKNDNPSGDSGKDITLVLGVTF